MPITLNHGPAGSGKTAFIVRTIAQNHIHNASPDSFFLVVPDRLAILRYQKLFLAEKNAPDLFNGERIVTFENFLAILLKTNLPKIREVCGSFTRNAIRKLLFQNTYKYLEDGKKYRSTVFKLAETFTELKKASITPRKAPILFARHMTPELSDICRLFSDYQNLLYGMDCFDDGDLYTTTLGLLDAGRLVLPAKISSVYFDRIFPLTLGQREIIKKLNSIFCGLDIVVSYSFDYKADDDPHLYPAYGFLGGIARNSNYFERACKKDNPSLHIFADPAEETEWITGEILSELNRGVLPHEIGVITPPEPLYHSRISSSLLQYGVTALPRCIHPAHFFSAHEKAPDLPDNFFAKEQNRILSDSMIAAVKTLREFENRWNSEADLLLSSVSGREKLDEWKKDELTHTIPDIPFKPGGVALLTLPESTGFDFKRLLVAGYADRYYPSGQKEHPFFTNEMLMETEMREILKSPLYRWSVEKNLVLQAINRTAGQVDFSFPKIMWDGREQFASRLVPELSTTDHTFAATAMVRGNTKKTPVFPKTRKKSFSLSELDSYRRCPYQYYCRYCLKLKEKRPEATDIPPDVQGSFVHRVLEKFLRLNLDLYRDAVEYDLYFKRLLEAVHTTVSWEEKNDSSLAGIPPVLRESFCGRVVLTLSGLLRREISLLREKKKKTIPAHFEWSFGKGRTPALKIRPEGLDISLTGRIDRIDVSSKNNIFTVIDYKTGDLPSASAIKSGESFLVPLYLMAVSSILYTEFEPAGGLLVGLGNLEKQSGLAIEGRGEEELLGKPWRITPQEWKSLKETVVEKTGLIVKNIHAGNFSPSPCEKEICRSCDYRNICHVEDLHDPDTVTN